MKRLRLLKVFSRLVLGLLVTAPGLLAQEVGQAAKTGKARKGTLDSSITARVDKLFEKLARPDSPGCSLGVSQNGALVYERGYGMANLELGVAITPASVFNIESISKQFTAMSILLLAQRGQLALDDDVRKYITELPDYGTPITLRHLLTHTSGLREGYSLLKLAGWRKDDIQRVDDLMWIIARQRALNFTPGTKYSYSNIGFELLAVIVKRVSGQSLRAFADANIFKPLGMLHTHFHDDPRMIVPNRASGYYSGAPHGDSAVDLQDLHLAMYATYYDQVGDGGLMMTARDMLLWQQNFADARVGGREVVEAMQKPTVLTGGDTSSYGLGLRLYSYRGLRAIGHGGAGEGFSAQVMRYPDQGLAIALFCNLANINNDALVHGVEDIYLADVFPAPAVRSVTAAPRSVTAAPPTVSLSAEQLASKVGLYRDSSNESLLRISIRDGKLRAHPGADVAVVGGTELRPVSENRFLLPSRTALEFVPAAAGRAQEVRVLAEGGKPRVFQQVNAFAPSSAELRAFEGEYVSSELETTYRLAVRDSGLVIQIKRMPDIVLRPTFTDAFMGAVVGVVKFSRDARGVVTGFTVTTRNVQGLRFDRVKQ